MLRRERIGPLALWFGLCLLGFAGLKGLLSLVALGVDFPIEDDWTEVNRGLTGSFAPVDLFAKANDTLVPVGRALDALGVYLIGGNHVVSQAITMIATLTSICVLQFSLLRRYAASTEVLFLATVAMVFSLQARTYWGMQTLAYHQILPVVSMMLILHLILRRDIERPVLHNLSIFVVGLLGGFAYLSGAIALLGATIWTVAWSFAMGDRGPRKSLPGLTAATILTLCVQIGIALLYRQGGGNSVRGVAMATPADDAFWAFFLGLVARSVGVFDSASIWVVAGASVLVLALVWALASQVVLARRERATAQQDLAYAFGFIAAFVFFYAVVVCAGRANLRPPTITQFRDVFALAQIRFHFFWLTLLWPWLALVVGNRFARRSSSVPLVTGAALSCLLLVALLTPFIAFDHDRYNAPAADRKAKGLACLQQKIAAGEPLYCPVVFSKDLANAVRLAKSLDIAFTRPLLIDETPLKLVPSRVLSEVNEIRLSFPPIGDESPVERIAIMFGTYMRVNEGIARLNLVGQKETETVEFRLGNLLDNSYHSFDVDPDRYGAGTISVVGGGGISAWESHAGSTPLTCMVFIHVNRVSEATPGCPSFRDGDSGNARTLAAAVFALLLAAGCIVMNRRLRR